MSQVCVHVVTHLPMTVALQPGYQYLYVGTHGAQQFALHPELTDRKHTGHIAEKNPNYCELTALHRLAADAVLKPDGIYGLVHYRRRFVRSNTLVNRLLSRLPTRWISPGRFKHFFARQEITSAEIEAIFQKGAEVILPSPWLLRTTVRDQYKKYHDANELHQLRQVLEEVCPAYLQAFDTVMASRSLRLFNMLIARGNVLSAYAQWLFPILTAFEQRIDLTRMNPYQGRIFGFLAERLLNVYFHHNSSLQVTSLPVAFIEP